jgi:succinoglycan biosynthesis protein ExoV
MKLYYATRTRETQETPGNFGDELNPWLWPQLLPGILDEDERVAFIGIGTLINQKLNRRLPNTNLKIIFSSGVGYDEDLKQIDETYRIYCVRGPLSADFLGISPDHAIIDGGVLASRLFQPKRQIKYKFSYMPHYSLSGEGWKKVCHSLNFGYIDPRSTLENVIESICQSEVVLAEAMHGAIIADAFRVPWIPVTSHSTILSFKWHDWCASVNLEYQPASIPRLHHPNPIKDILTPVRSVRDFYRQKVAAAQLALIAKDARPLLSDSKLLESLTVRLEEKLEDFKNDWKKGYFS